MEHSNYSAQKAKQKNYKLKPKEETGKLNT